MTSRVLGQSLDLYHIYISYISVIYPNLLFSVGKAVNFEAASFVMHPNLKIHRHPTWDVGIGESRSKTETIKWTWVQSQAESTTEAAVPSSPEKCWSNFKLGGYERPSQSRPRWHSPTGSGKKQVPLIGKPDNQVEMGRGQTCGCSSILRNTCHVHFLRWHLSTSFVF